MQLFFEEPKEGTAAPTYTCTGTPHVAPPWPARIVLSAPGKRMTHKATVAFTPFCTMKQRCRTCEFRCLCRAIHLAHRTSSLFLILVMPVLGLREEGLCCRFDRLGLRAVVLSSLENRTDNGNRWMGRALLLTSFDRTQQNPHKSFRGMHSHSPCLRGLWLAEQQER